MLRGRSMGCSGVCSYASCSYSSSTLDMFGNRHRQKRPERSGEIPWYPSFHGHPASFQKGKVVSDRLLEVFPQGPHSVVAKEHRALLPNALHEGDTSGARDVDVKSWGKTWLWPRGISRKEAGIFGQGTLRYLAIVICLVVRGDNPI